MILNKKQARGFSLVATITVMVILSLVALGLLTLTGVTMRSSKHDSTQMEAKANARMALSIALGELQECAGPDRRITADADLLESGVDNTNPNKAVGVWSSWGEKNAHDGIPDSTGPGENPDDNPIAIDNPEDFNSSKIDYSSDKRARFYKWLVSNPDRDAVEEVGFGTSLSDSSTSRTLFSREKDGFDLHAPSVELEDEQGKTTGAYAWAVVQENTKAKILPDSYTRANKSEGTYDGLVAPQTLGIELSEVLNENIENDPTLARKLVSLASLEVSEAIEADDTASINPDYTVYSKGVFSDALRGRLKRDLSAAFELSDGEFASLASKRGNIEALGDFDGGKYGFEGEQPLFIPSDNFEGINHVTDNFSVKETEHYFKIGHLPTFQALRSHYRTYRHLYNGSSGTSAWERMRESAGYQSEKVSETALLPVLDRVVIYMSIMKDEHGRLSVVLNPFVILWNPYNVELQTEGYTVFPRIDFPVVLEMSYRSRVPRVNVPPIEVYLSNLLSSGARGTTGTPYFFLQLKAPGSDSMSFQPGELRVFSMEQETPQDFSVISSHDGRAYAMNPVEDSRGLNYSGGIKVKLYDPTPSSGSNYFPHEVNNAGELRVTPYYYYVDKNINEDLRLHFQVKEKIPTSALDNWEAYGDVAAVQMSGGVNQGYDNRDSERIEGERLTFGDRAGFRLYDNEPQVFAFMILNHRTAKGASDSNDDESRYLVSSDLAITNNCRQPYATALLNGYFTEFDAAPHYGLDFFTTTSAKVGAFFDVPNGRNALWGASNSSQGGRSHVIFSEIPRYPLLSLGSFQHMDMSNNIFSPYYQFANSYWSPYYVTEKVYADSEPKDEYVKESGPNPEVYDYGYLTNEALWDGYYFSGAAPEYRISSGGGKNAYSSDQISITKAAESVVREFVENPTENPLRNGRHHLYAGAKSMGQILGRLKGEDAYHYMASHLMLDGSFNINSTSVEAWTAFLASARDEGNQKGDTLLSRNHYLSGEANDHWVGFRSLRDSEIRSLAEALVVEIKARNDKGPFLSLAEFVNRNITENSKEGQFGVLQAAINKANLNSKINYGDLPNPEAYGDGLGKNMLVKEVGVGIPGYLSQGDVLTSIGPYVTPRSDTFVIRAQGESRNAAGEVIGKATCEAVVQRVPDYVDDSEDAANSFDDINETNKRYGRKFKVINFRWLTPKEVS